MGEAVVAGTSAQAGVRPLDIKCLHNFAIPNNNKHRVVDCAAFNIVGGQAHPTGRASASEPVMIFTQ